MSQKHECLNVEGHGIGLTAAINARIREWQTGHPKARVISHAICPVWLSPERTQMDTAVISIFYDEED